MQDRPTLGLELGTEGLKNLTLPKNLFDDITSSPLVPMQCKGPNGTEAVASLIFAWILSKFGNVHTDSMFNDRIGALLSEKWPLIKPYGKPYVDERTGQEIQRIRTWSEIIKNRFSNQRGAKV